MRIVSGRLSGRRLVSPRGRGTRPTSDRVREALGSALESRGSVRDARILDLYAGSGALSFEMLSRGAQSAVLIDRDVQSIACIRANAEALGLEDAVHIRKLDLGADAARLAEEIKAPKSGFTLVFADAPYSQTQHIAPLLAQLISRQMLSPEARIAIEHDSNEPWQWIEGLALDADYRYGRTRISLGLVESKEAIT